MAHRAAEEVAKLRGINFRLRMLTVDPNFVVDPKAVYVKRWVEWDSNPRPMP